MTDKPTDEIERRAEESLNTIKPTYITGDTGQHLYSEDSMRAMFRFGHSAAKEEVEGLNHAMDCMQLDYGHAQAQLKHELDEARRSYVKAATERAALEAEIAELKDKVNSVWSDFVDHESTIQSLKTAQKELIHFIQETECVMYGGKKHADDLCSKCKLLARHRKVGE